MTYISAGYAIFISILCAFYYSVPNRFRKYILLIGSIVFYILNVEALIVLPVLSTLVAFFAGRYIEKETKKRKIILAFAVISIILIWFFFKWGLWIGGFWADISAFSLLVPLGISFYSLALIGYCVDIYRGTSKAETNFFKMLLFSLFFPHVVQGPIPRFSAISDKLWDGHDFDYTGFKFGLQLILWGLIEKLIVANWLALIVDNVYSSNGELGGGYVFLAFVMYSIQLYADFDGCVNIATGSAELFGIHLSANFKQPYFATSVQDFWRRWHISLSSWLRDYVYIPLGGNRRGYIQKLINTMAVFLVSGIWHGVGITYLIWGIGHGALVIFDNIIDSIVKKRGHQFKAVSLLRRFLTLGSVTLLWGLFRAESLRQFLSLLRAGIKEHNYLGVLTNPLQFELSGLRFKSWLVVMLFVGIMFGVDLAHNKGIRIREYVASLSLHKRWIIYFFAVTALILFGMYGPGFSKSMFIYGNF